MAGLQNKVIVITGASEGIGRALAGAMAPLGCHLVLSGRNLSRLESLAREITQYGPTPLIFPADLGEPAQCRALIQAAMDKFGRLDILLNNAGMTMWSRFDQLSRLEVLDEIIRINYLAPAYLTHAALPHLKASQGQLVVVASVAGLTGVPTRSGYAASKHAVIGFFDSLRIELADDGVAVTVLCPDFVVSQIHKRALDGRGEPLGRSPMQEARIISAEQCARMMLPAIIGRKRLYITSFRGRLGRWLRLIAPGLVDRLARRAIACGH